MIVLETSAFTRRICELLRDEEYRLLQYELVINPTLGKLIPGGAGLRKIRWQAPGRGKRGGVRVIYYVVAESGTLLMLFAYAKSDRDDLTKSQISALAALVRKEFH